MELLSCLFLVLLAAVPQSRAQSGPSGSGAIRLVRDGFTSSDYTSGVVQVWWNGEWGNICYSHSVFGHNEADVICHHLGWSGASDYTQSQYDSYDDDTSPTTLSSLSCSNSQYINIFQCTYSTLSSIFCNDNTDVSVTCYSTRIWDDPYDGQIRLQDGTYSNQGLVEVYCNGEWGTICDDYFGWYEARVVCRQLGYNDYYDYDHLSITGDSFQKIWFNELDCFSLTYNCIGNCASCPSAESHSCFHSEDVTIECDISTSLSDSDTDTSTCENADVITLQVDTAIAVGAIVGGIVAGIICLIIICAIPICICICVGCIAGASSSKRPRTTVTKAAPATTAAVVATTSQQASSYPMQPTTTTGYPQQQQGYPQQQAPDGHGTKDGGYPPQQGYGYPPQGQPYPPTDAGYPPQGDNPPPYPT